MDGLFPYIDAFIALLATLYGFALIVTLLVELGHRTLALDGKRMRIFLQTYIADRLSQRGLKLSAPEQLIENLINPLGSASASAGGVVGAWRRYFRDRSVGSIEWKAFLDELQLQKVWGDMTTITADAKAALDRQILDLETSYNVLCTRMKRVWGQYARVWAFAVGIILALAVNLNVVNLYSFYLENPAAAAAAIADYEAAQKDASGALTGPCAVSSDASAAPTPGEADKACEETAENVINDAKAALARIADEKSKLQARGLPMGWLTGSFDVESAKFWSAVPAILVTGLILGIGAPQLHSLIQALLGLRGRKKESEPAPT